MPILLAIIGAGLLAFEFWAFRFLGRALGSGQLQEPWPRRRVVALILGGALVLTIPLQAYPLKGGTAVGTPFLAAWHDAQGRDYVGAITLPALIGNAVVWFLAPQAVLAFRARQHLKKRPLPRVDG